MHPVSLALCQSNSIKYRFVISWEFLICDRVLKLFLTWNCRRGIMHYLLFIHWFIRSCYDTASSFTDLLQIQYGTVLIRSTFTQILIGELWGVSCDYRNDVIEWKHFSRYWPIVRGIQWSPVNSPHKGQWRGVLMFSLICAWINGWVNNCEVGDSRRHLAHYDVIVM